MHDKANEDAVERIRSCVAEIEAEYDLETAFWSMDAVYDDKDKELWEQTKEQ